MLLPGSVMDRPCCRGSKEKVLEVPACIVLRGCEQVHIIAVPESEGSRAAAEVGPVTQSPGHPVTRSLPPVLSA